MKKGLWILLGLLWSGSLALGFNAWGLYGAYWSPKDGDDSFGPGLKVSIEMVPGVQLEIRTAYFDDVASDINLKVIPLEAGLALYQPLADRLSVYGGGGFAYYFMDADDPRVDDQTGFYFTGGLEFDVQPNAALFAEVQYLDASADTTGSDLNLDGPGVNAGLLIKW